MGVSQEFSPKASIFFHSLYYPFNDQTVHDCTVLYLCETLAVRMSSLQQITNVYECPYFATHFLQSFWFLPQKPPVGSEYTTKWNLGLK